MPKEKATKRKPIKADKEEKVPKVEPEEDELINSIIVDLNAKEPGAAMTLEKATHAQVQGWISSGNIDLDEALGGGWPLGRVVEVFGPESNGKTTVALHAIAECQKDNGVAIFLDNEHALDRARAKTIGVNLNKMIYAQPDTMEDVFEFVSGIIESIRKKNSERPVLIVWDSVAATGVKAEMDGDYDQQHVAIHARVMSQSFRKINPLINKEKICFMCINQNRDKVGVQFGEKQTTPGKQQAHILLGV